MWLIEAAKQRWREQFLKNKTAVGIDVNCDNERAVLQAAIENDMKEEEERQKNETKKE
ncbi:MAG: hypothetical protein J5746_13225 [Victivallales bacterium]|nr:hypothetical protein [Victivallales bacterium]